MSRPSRRARRSAPVGAAAAPAALPPASQKALLALLLFAVTLLAYQPVWHAGFIWDDDDYVTQNPTLHDAGGVRRIWFEVGAVPQYYPLVHTVLWVEAHLWGMRPLGYHVVNVLLHCLAALLLAEFLLRVQIPGAWLAAFLFALHPVAVESVAWVTELKNVLSTVFYLAALLAYWRFAERRDHGRLDRRAGMYYGGALLFFLAALFSKTVTCSLPAALLLLRWWNKGRLRVADVMPLLPFFVVGATLGLLTASMERHHLGAQGVHWALTFTQRCLIAGRALWFYAAELLWPARLMFIYPRWQVDPGVWWQWLFPIAALAVILVLWLTRQRIGRGPFAAVCFFAGTLAPALGFVNVYPMRYSFVADHFQYLASIGLITLAAVVLRTAFAGLERRGPLLQPALCATLLLPLAILTRQHAETLTDLETLWRTTIARNPECSMCHNNLGNLLLAREQVDQALVQFEKAVAIEPANTEALDSLGTVLLRKGRVDEAMAHFRQAVQQQPTRAASHYNLGTALLQKNQVDAAIAEFQRAVTLQPQYALAHNNLGNAFFGQGRVDDAIVQYQQALEFRPDLPEAANNLGSALLRTGQIGAAIVQYQRALQLRPHFPQAAEGVRAVAWLRATSPDTAVRDGAAAIELAQQLERATGGGDALVLATLAAAYAETARFPEATAAAQRALTLARAQNADALAGEIHTQLGFYASRTPYRAPQ